MNSFDIDVIIRDSEQNARSAKAWEKEALDMLNKSLDWKRKAEEFELEANRN